MPAVAARTVPASLVKLFIPVQGRRFYFFILLFWRSSCVLLPILQLFDWQGAQSHVAMGVPQPRQGDAHTLWMGRSCSLVRRYLFEEPLTCESNAIVWSSLPHFRYGYSEICI